MPRGIWRVRGWAYRQQVRCVDSWLISFNRGVYTVIFQKEKGLIPLSGPSAAFVPAYTTDTDGSWTNVTGHHGISCNLCKDRDHSSVTSSLAGIKHTAWTVGGRVDVDTVRDRQSDSGHFLLNKAKPVWHDPVTVWKHGVEWREQAPLTKE